MPLENGKSQAVVSRNIARERDAGKPERQAIAIAESKAREAKDCGAMDDRSAAMSEVCRLIAILAKKKMR